MNITTGKISRAQKIVLYGPEGIGKTTFEASAPDRPNLSKLRNLMAAENITDADMQAYCAEKGYCTAETALDVYPEDFAGYLVATWADIATELAVPFI